MRSIIGSPFTAAAGGTVGVVCRDPIAMLAFSGYGMGHHFGQRVSFHKQLGKITPKIFYTNWFQADGEGRLIWPGFGENSRVLCRCRCVSV